MSSVTTPDPKQESSAHVNSGNSLKLISATVLSFRREGINTHPVNPWNKKSLCQVPEGHLCNEGSAVCFMDGVRVSSPFGTPRETPHQECTLGCSLQKLLLRQTMQVLLWASLRQTYSWPTEKLQAAECNTILCGSKGPSK